MGVLRSFTFALEGIRHFLQTQRNARIEAVIGIAAVIIGVRLGLAPIEWVVLTLTIALVMILEGLNTVLEIAIDLSTPEVEPRAKAAKDISAGMVLIAAIASVVVGLVLFGPKLVALLS